MFKSTAYAVFSFGFFGLCMFLTPTTSGMISQAAHVSSVTYKDTNIIDQRCLSTHIVDRKLYSYSGLNTSGEQVTGLACCNMAEYFCALVK